jgi:hypothetical protein
VHDGTAQSLSFDDEGKLSEPHSIDLFRYPESVRIAQKSSKNELPNDVALKSHNDLVQSIASSILKSDDPYSWIICEGTSDKIYLQCLLAKHLEKNRTRIIPVAGRDEVRRLYEFLVLSLRERKKDIKGRVVCLIDSDASTIEVSQPPLEKLIEFKRLLLKKDEVQLLPWNSKEVAPETAIEDCLPAAAFLRTLSTFVSEHEALSPILKELPNGTTAKYAGSLDLKRSSYHYLKHDFFLRGQGAQKVNFANAFCDAMNKDQPLASAAWAKDLSDFLGTRKS